MSKPVKFTKTFEARDESFVAFEEARSWLQARGFSVGRMQREDPIGIMMGDHDIQKWRHLSKEDREELDGILTGDKRHGPITVELYVNPDGSEIMEDP